MQGLYLFFCMYQKSSCFKNIYTCKNMYMHTTLLPWRPCKQCSRKKTTQIKAVDTGSLSKRTSLRYSVALQTTRDRQLTKLYSLVSALNYPFPGNGQVLHVTIHFGNGQQIEITTHSGIPIHFTTHTKKIGEYLVGHLSLESIHMYSLHTYIRHLSPRRELSLCLILLRMLSLFCFFAFFSLTLLACNRRDQHYQLCRTTFAGFLHLYLLSF